ncbi:hypothetical protein MMC26_002062 [Xylographa opegraphella]|nr:hypothetical protein [Xylographa opegraphella]
MSDIQKLADNLASKGPFKVEDSPKRVRILQDGKYIVDTTHAKYVWEHPYYPQYYVPRSDVNADFVQAHDHSPSIMLCTFRTPAREIPNVLVFTGGPLAGLVRFDFKAMDAWFEEDQRICVHPVDPYKRVDNRRSSRHVRIVVDDVTVAETSNATFLFETMLRTRYYLPATCIDPSLLSESATVTSCPYKGDASYYNLTVNGKEHKDVIWYYKFPILESSAIAGLLCFYNEKVDVWIDGVKE